MEQLEIGMQYVKVDGGETDAQTTEHASKIASLQNKLATYKLTMERLTQELNDHLLPFCEQSFVTDEYTKYHSYWFA